MEGRIAIPPFSLAVVQKYYRGEWGPPKTGAGVRTIPLTARLWVELSIWQERCGQVSPDDPVFMARTGQPWDEHNIAADHLKPAGRKIGAPWVSWHCFRHTASTAADRAGMTDAEKEKLFGWASKQMRGRYTHPELETIRERMERMEARVIQ